jgi:hypothetical protein
MRLMNNQNLIQYNKEMNMSPFSTEPASVEKQPEPEANNTPKQIPNDLVPILNKYQKVVENPQNLDNLWNFVQVYLTFLELKAFMILPIIKEINSNVQKEDNIILALKECRISNIPWGVYNMFITISNIGSQIASKQTKDSKDQFYLMYVMMSLEDNDSPVYNFTELLKSIHDTDLYKNLDKKFLDAFKKYEKSDSFMEKSVDILGNPFKVKWIILIIIIVVLLIVAIGLYYYKNKNSVDFTDDMSITSS